MLSKNNYKERLQKMEQKKERFSIRKFSVGAASVLIGLFFMGLGSQTTVHAETVTPQVQTAAKEETTPSSEANVDGENTTAASEAVSSAAALSSSAAPSSSASSAANSATKTASQDTANFEKEVVKNDVAKNKPSNVLVKAIAENKVAVATSAPSSTSVTHANGTGNYTQNGITVPAITEPQASEFWKEFNKIITPMSKEDLAKIGLDENTYYESPNNSTKWHAIGWLEAYNTENTTERANVGTFLYHNPDGTLAVPGINKWMTNDVTDAWINTEKYSTYGSDFKGYLVPIISVTSSIYVNKGVTLSYEDIKRALASNSEAIRGLISGDWVTDEQAQGVKVVNVNKPGLQEGAVRLTYVNGTKTSASINVDVVDLQGQTTYVNVNSPLPDADTVISGQPAGSKNIKWITNPDLSKAGVSTGEVEVTYPDGNKGTTKVTFNVEDPQGKAITVHVGQEVTPNDVVVSNTYPAGSTVTWVTEPRVDVAGKQNVSVVVTYPNGVSSHEVPAVITVVAPKGQDITTPNSVVPSAEKGISNVPDMPTGTTYTWKETPEVKTPGTKDATVVVTFPDGNKVEVPVKVIVGDPTPQGQDITTPNSVVPSAEKGISNVPDMPTGTTYTWKETPEVKTPGTKDATVVVTFPDGNKVEVPVKVIVGDPTPQGQDIHTPQGQVPDPSKGISNIPDMPSGTKYEWKDIPDVTTPGNKPATIVVTFPDGKTIDVPVTVIVDKPTAPTDEKPVAPKATEPKPQGQDIHTPQGQVPDPSKGISNKPELPAGTKYEWKDTPDVTTPGTHSGIIVVTYPDGKRVEVPVNIIVDKNNDNEIVAPVHSGDTPDKDNTIGHRSTETIAPVKSAHVTTTNNGNNSNNIKVAKNYIDRHTKTLPQTGSDNTAAMLGIMIASVSAIIGLAAEKKRRN